MFVKVDANEIVFITIHCTTMSSPQLFLLSFNVKCYLLFWDIYVLLIASCVVTHEGRN